MINESCPHPEGRIIPNTGIPHRLCSTGLLHKVFSTMQSFISKKPKRMPKFERMPKVWISRMHISIAKKSTLVAGSQRVNLPHRISSNWSLFLIEAFPRIEASM